MSSYMFMDIYTKKNGFWENVVHDKEFFYLKNLTSTRCHLSDEIENAPLSEEDFNELEKLTHNYDIHEFEFHGSVEKENWEKLGIEATPYKGTSFPDEEGLLISAEDLKKIHFIDPFSKEDEEYKKLDDSQVVKIYTEKVSARGYGNINFYNVESFSKYRDKKLLEYQELLFKKKHFEDMQKTLDYCKLSSEEKENVLSETEWLEEELNDILWQIRSADCVIGAIELFNDYDSNDTVAMIFGE